MLILVRVNSIEERVLEALLLGLPSFTLKLRTRLRFLPLAPFNARCEGFGLIFHGSPPLLGRTSADGAARLPRRPLMWLSPGLSLSRFRHTLVKAQRGCQGINTSCPVSGSLYVSISWFIPETTIGSLRTAGWGNLQDEVSSPRQTVLLDRIGDQAAGLLVSSRREAQLAAHVRRSMVRRVPTYPKPETNLPMNDPPPTQILTAPAPTVTYQVQVQPHTKSGISESEAATATAFIKEELAKGKISPE